MNDKLFVDKLITIITESFLNLKKKYNDDLIGYGFMTDSDISGFEIFYLTKSLYENGDADTIYDICEWEYSDVLSPDLKIEKRKLCEYMQNEIEKYNDESFGKYLKRFYSLLCKALAITKEKNAFDINENILLLVHDTDGWVEDSDQLESLSTILTKDQFENYLLMREQYFL